MFEIDGMRVEIGKTISTDGGVVFVARRIRRSAWFKALVWFRKFKWSSHR